MTAAALSLAALLRRALPPVDGERSIGTLRCDLRVEWSSVTGDVAVERNVPAAILEAVSAATGESH